jgi:hypothetical protein
MQEPDYSSICPVALNPVSDSRHASEIFLLIGGHYSEPG